MVADSLIGERNFIVIVEAMTMQQSKLRAHYLGRWKFKHPSKALYLRPGSG